jgi:glycosyltransferase involved in cell wall biosynthesis
LKLSIVIPAHNEEAWLAGCLGSIGSAARGFSGQIEVIVVLNRCTDGTEGIARTGGAIVVREDARNLARIRNAGVAAARGEWLVTIDADSRMSPNLLQEVELHLRDPGVVGGGTRLLPERWSPGIRATAAFLELAQYCSGLSAGAFWCRRADFLAIGGFDERLHFAEDADLARRLRVHGRATGRAFVRIGRAHIVTSCRKFDRFGDWHYFPMLLRHPLRLKRGLHGRDHWFADRYFYDFKRTACDRADEASRGS